MKGRNNADTGLKGCLSKPRQKVYFRFSVQHELKSVNTNVYHNSINLFPYFQPIEVILNFAFYFKINKKIKY